MYHPKRLGDPEIYFTAPEHHGLAHRDRAREVIWIPNGLCKGQLLTISEKPSSPAKGLFQEIPSLHSATPFQTSGRPRGGPGRGEDAVIWSYQIVLSSHGRELARIDPEIVLVPDP